MINLKKCLNFYNEIITQDKMIFQFTYTENGALEFSFNKTTG